MALQNLVGAGLWIPNIPAQFYSNARMAISDTALLDADEEESQIIGQVHIDGGGSKTFGTSSFISWLPGASITFGAVSTLTVGVKKAASVDTANGPPARATIGAAAFDVYKPLVGGVDTITSATWRDDAMTLGTPFTVTDGDLIAICWHLDVTSGSPSVKIRHTVQTAALGFPSMTLVTSGPTYTNQANLTNCILTFDDGTLGWIEPTWPFSVIDGASGTIGNTNIFGNIFRVPFTCKIDAIAAVVNESTSGANFDLVLYSTPLATPAIVEAISVDANTKGVTGGRNTVRRLLTPRTLTIGTDYCVGVKQTTATAVTVDQRDVSTAAYFKPLGMGAECYGATSTAGATFAAINSGKRRYNVYVRISALDDGVTSYPIVGDVRSGVAYDTGLTGTLALPAVGDVDSTAAGYGAGGSEFAGTLVVPAITDVKSGVSYGAGGSEFTGTLAGGGGTVGIPPIGII